MLDHDIKYVENVTRMNSEKRKSLANLYRSLPEKLKVEVHKIQSDIIRQKRDCSSKGKHSEFVYSCLLLAVENLRNFETGLNQKNTLSLDNALKITESRIAGTIAERKKKSSPLRDMIETTYFEEIKQLRRKGLSWREIARYIQKFHKLTMEWSRKNGHFSI